MREIPWTPARVRGRDHQHRPHRDLRAGARRRRPPTWQLRRPARAGTSWRTARATRRSWRIRWASTTRYDESTRQYAHEAAIMILTPGRQGLALPLRHRVPPARPAAGADRGLRKASLSSAWTACCCSASTTTRRRAPTCCSPRTSCERAACSSSCWCWRCSCCGGCGAVETAGGSDELAALDSVAGRRAPHYAGRVDDLYMFILFAERVLLPADGGLAGCTSCCATGAAARARSRRTSRTTQAGDRLDRYSAAARDGHLLLGLPRLHGRHGARRPTRWRSRSRPRSGSGSSSTRTARAPSTRSTCPWASP